MKIIKASLIAAVAAIGCRESCENLLLECIADCNADSNCISECQRNSEDCFSSCEGDVHLLIFEPSSDPEFKVPEHGNQIKFSWNRQTSLEFVQNVQLATPPEYDTYRKEIAMISPIKFIRNLKSISFKAFCVFISNEWFKLSHWWSRF